MVKKANKKRKIDNKKKKTLKKGTVSVNRQSPPAFKIGDNVAAKPGDLDLDSQIGAGGWQGKISDIEKSDDEMSSDTDAPVWNKNKRALIVTVTGEPYQPSRVFYELTDPEKIQNIFSRLRCMDYDPDQLRWVWLYHAESKKLKFLNSYSKIPINLRPIVIGSFFIISDNEMFLDVNSFERVTKAITFFDEYLPKTVAKVTDVAIVNKMFSNIDGTAPQHKDFFDNNPKVMIRSGESVTEISKVVSSASTQSERLILAQAHFDKMAKEQLPEIERLPSNFYEDGIEGLEMKLKMRIMIAHEHWLGNKDYSFYDLMQKITPKL